MSWRTSAVAISSLAFLPWGLFVETWDKLLGIKGMIWPIYMISVFLVTAWAIAVLFAYLSDYNSRIAELKFFQ